MDTTQPDYLAYLLRLWRPTGDTSDPSGGARAWRASLQNAHSGASVGFASLDELFDYLCAQIAGDLDRPEGTAHLTE